MTGGTSSGAGKGPATSSQGFGLTFAVLCTLLVVTLCAQLPSGVAPSWLAGRSGVYADIWPQNWAFFAAQPDSGKVTAYRIASGDMPAAALMPQMSAENLWGMGQTSTTEFDEALFLASRLPGNDWTSCADPLSHACVADAKSVRLTNGFQPAILCGLVEFVRTPPPSPSAAAMSREADGATPGLVAVVDLGCGG